MKYRFVWIVSLVCLLTLVLVGCGGKGKKGNNDNRLQVMTIQGKIENSGSTYAVATPVAQIAVNVYDFKTGVLFGAATTDAGGRFSLANIPVGVDLLLIANATSEGENYRFSVMVSKVSTFNGSNIVINTFSSAVSEAMAKLFQNGVGIDQDFVEVVGKQVLSANVMNGFTGRIGTDLSAKYGDEPLNTKLAEVQREFDNGDLAKVMAIARKARTGFFELGVFSEQSGLLFISSKGLRGAVEPFGLLIYSLVDVLKAAGDHVTGPLTGTQTVTWQQDGQSYTAVVASDGEKTLSVQLYRGNTVNANQRIFDATIQYTKNPIGTSQVVGHLAISGNVAIPNGEGIPAGTYFVTYDGNLDVTWTTNANHTVTGINVNKASGECIAKNQDETYRSNGGYTGGFSLATGKMALNFDGSVDTPYITFHGKTVLNGKIIKTGINTVYTISTIGAEVTQFTAKQGTSRLFPFPYTMAGRINLSLDDSHITNWNAPESNTNYILGTLTINGSVVSAGNIAGDQLNLTVSRTGFREAKLDITLFYDLNSKKQIGLSATFSNNGPEHIALTSTEGVAMSIDHNVSTGAFSGGVTVDGAVVGTVSSDSNAVYINYMKDNVNQRITLWQR